jgi:hypothetical protein
VNRQRQAVAAWLGVAALYLWVRLPLLGVPLDRDEGAFALIGRGLLQGELPYRDLFDHKPPGVFAIYAFAVGLFPDTANGIHLFLMLWNLATLLVVASLAASLYGRAAGIAAAWLFALVSAAPSVQGFTAGTEMLLLLPMVASIRLAVGEAVGTPRLLLSGLLGAFACWIKQPAALPLLVVPLMLMRDAGLRRVGIWLAGGAGFSALVVALFAVAGVFDEFAYWGFTRSAQYGAENWWMAAERLGIRIVPMLRDFGLPVAALLVLPRRHRRLPSLLFLLSFASLFHAPFFYRHYFAILCPALALGGGAAFATVWDRLSSERSRVALVVGSAILSLAFPMALRPDYWLQRPSANEISRQVLGRQGFEAAPEIAAYLRERTAPDDTVFVYGSEPQIPFLAGRRGSNPYTMLYPLTDPGERAAEFQQEVWRRLTGAPPRYILLTSNRGSLARWRSYDSFLEDNLRELLRTGYRLEATVVRTPEDALSLVSPPPARDVPWQFRLYRKLESGS